MLKNPPANVRDIRETGSITGSGRSHGGGHGNPLQYSCLENLRDNGAWQTMVHRVAKSRTQLKSPSPPTLFLRISSLRERGVQVKIIILK